MQFRKKPVVIEAVQYDGSTDSEDAVCRFCPTAIRQAGTRILQIPTLEGVHNATPGDFIIKGIKGEFYPCKPDIFEATYDKELEPSELPQLEITLPDPEIEPEFEKFFEGYVMEEIPFSLGEVGSKRHAYNCAWLVQKFRKGFYKAWNRGSK